MNIFENLTNPSINTNYSSEEVLLSVQNINLSYLSKNNKTKHILKDINFNVKDIKRPGMKQGQIVSLIGRSGIGKSQLFRIISGFNEIGSKTETQNLTGRVLINKEQTPVKLGEIGVVTQNYKLLEHRTVKKNLLFSGTPLEIIKEYAAEFEILEHLDKFPMELSGGQRQRTAILQQVLAGNKFILLDEPFSGLDEIMLKKTLKLLLKVSLLSEEQTLIIISHDIENCLAISDTALLLTKPNPEEGAIILEEHKFDLAKMNIAWENNIRELPKFRELLRYVKSSL